MQIGDQLFHVPNGRVVTVRSTKTGNGMVGCCWLIKDQHGNIVERMSGFDWQELRLPTTDELKAEELRMAELRGEKIPAKAEDPGKTPDSAAASSSETPAPSEPTETPHKKKNR